MIWFGAGIIFAGLLCLYRGVVEYTDIIKQVTAQDAIYHMATEAVRYIAEGGLFFIGLGILWMLLGLLYKKLGK